MKKSRYYLLTFLLSISFVLTNAQERQLTGTVTGDQKESLPGVSIVIKGTATGTITDMNGNYNLTVSPNDVLVYSFIGFEIQEVLYSGQANIDVRLQIDVEDIDEVVVIGYGTVRKKDLTGSVSSVRVEESVARQSPTVDQLIIGRAAGVQVTSNSGSPGSGVSVRIRGANSLRGNNEPLYVVDGVIISSAGEDAMKATDNNSMQENQNGLNGINPRDIETIEILKDASATAIYGSRGANGVVMITTKRGAAGKVNVNAYITTGVSEISKKIDVLDGLNYAKYKNENSLLNGNNPEYHISNGEVYPMSYDDDDNPVIRDEAAQQMNWHDEIYKMGMNYNAGASFSGGTDKGNYYVSVGYNDQGGIVETSRLQSGDFRMNLNQELTKRLVLDGRVSAFYSKGNFAQDGDRAGGQRSFISNILKYNPLVTGDELDYYDQDSGLSGPYTWLNDFEDTSEESRIVGSLSLTYDLPVKGLKYKIQAGGNIRDKERRRFYGLTTFQGSATNGTLSMSNLKSMSYQINNLVTYNRTLNKNHRINAMVGFTWDVKNSNNSVYEVQDFSTLTFTTKQPFYGQSITSPLREFESKTQLLSYLGRAIYSFKDRYIFTGSFRVDGSSKFKGSNQYSVFPSFSTAWRAIEESFIKDLNVFSDLKLRAGWGRIGNQGIAPYQTFANYNGILNATTTNGTSIAWIPANVQNEDLKWETTEQINVGLDFAFLNNRISASVDAYSKETKDLLLRKSLPPTSGFGTIFVNAGTISNKGLEVTMSGTVIDKKDMSFEIGGNIAFNKSEILELGIPSDSLYINGVKESRSFYRGDNVSTGGYFKCPANIFMVGEEIGLFYGYQTNGIYQTDDEILVSNTQPGDIRIIDQNGDGVINGDDRTIIGNPNPDFVFGINLNFRYKRFNLSALMNGVVGNEVINGNLLNLGTPEGNRTNILSSAYHNAWRADAPSTSYPRIGYDKENQAGAITDRIIEDGSYFRLSNITMGYDLPLEKLFSRCNVYVSGLNLLTLTDYSGYNPVTTSFMSNGNILGVDWNGFPNARTILVGLNINF
jgi:TonB-linked SusC/RagA family outer membrane protein